MSLTEDNKRRLRTVCNGEVEVECGDVFGVASRKEVRCVYMEGSIEAVKIGRSQE